MQIRKTINQSVKQMSDLIRQKNNLFNLVLETDFWFIDNKKVEEGKELMVGGKKQSIKPASTTFTSLLECEKRTVPIL